MIFLHPTSKTYTRSTYLILPYIPMKNPHTDSSLKIKYLQNQWFKRWEARYWYYFWEFVTSAIWNLFFSDQTQSVQIEREILEEFFKSKNWHYGNPVKKIAIILVQGDYNWNRWFNISSFSKEYLRSSNLVWAKFRDIKTMDFHPMLAIN